VALGQVNGAAGTIFQTITFTNTSGGTCVLNGYPGLALLDSGHHAMPLTVERGCRTAADCPRPTEVRVLPRGTASFRLSFNDVPQNDARSCATSDSGEVTPPNDFSSLPIPLKIAPCGPAPAPPVVDVSAVFAGS
jgi:hypothetical protein